MSSYARHFLTRRRFLVGLSIGAALPLLAACGGGATPAVAPSVAAPQATKPAIAPTVAPAPTSTGAAAITVPSAAGAATPAPATAAGAAPAKPAGQGGAVAPDLRLGFQPPYVSVFVMQKQKLLEEEFKGDKINIEYRKLLSPTPIYEALTGSSLDIGMGGPPVAALASGQPFRIIALTERSPKTHALLVTPDSPIKEIGQLKGKKLATPLGKAYAFPLRVLEKAQLKDTDVTWLTIDNTEGRSSLLTGAIDVWGTWDPFYAGVEFDKQARKLIDGDPFYPNYVTMFARADYVDKYPETIKRFLRTYNKALTWVKANRNDALAIFTEENKFKPEVAELTWNRRNYLLSAPNDEFIADVTEQGKTFLRLGVTKAEPNWSTAIDTSLARAALGM